VLNAKGYNIVWLLLALNKICFSVHEERRRAMETL